MGIVNDDRPIHIDGAYEPRIDARHGRIVKEPASVPAATYVASAEISKAVIDAAVKTDSRSPVSGRPNKPNSDGVPTPVPRCPEQPRVGRQRPHPRHPEIAGSTPRPVARDPDVPGRHYGRLRIGWYRRWRRVNHHTVTHLHAIRHRHTVTQRVLSAG